MEKRKVVLLVLITLYFIACAASYQGFREPTSDQTMVVVGRVLVQDIGYTDRPELYKKDIRVGIYGRAENGDDIGEWLTTDENGYYVLTDVPKGEYVLKAIQLTVGTGQLLTIENRLSYADDSYFITSRDFIAFNASYFPFEPVGRVQSLKHTIFTLDLPNRNVTTVKFAMLNTLDNITVYGGEVLNEGPVERYFIEKYPTSNWKEPLEQSANIIRYKR
jgi:hypothetical protein